MIEQEAKTKWCPFARVSSAISDDRTQTFVGVAGANRVHLSDLVSTHPTQDKSNPESAHCIGSACMAWRIQTDGWVLDFIGNDAVMRKPTYMAEPHGYCGLAGKP